MRYTTNSENAVIFEIVKTVVKSKENAKTMKGAIYNGTLRLIVNGGIFYFFDISDLVPPDALNFFTGTYEERSEENMEIDEFGEEIMKKVEDEAEEAEKDMDMESLRFGMDQETINWLITSTDQLINIKGCLPILYTDEDLISNPNFTPIKNMKVKDGFYKFHFPMTTHNSFMIIHKAIFGLNKGDALTVKILDMGNNNLLVVFNEYKKKIKREYEIYFVVKDLPGESIDYKATNNFRRIST